MRKPNVVYIIADEWRAQATGHTGDPNCETPVLDALAAESISFQNAVSGCPVCCPARASILTGLYPLSHGVFINDVELDPTIPALPGYFGGYATGYIGKWHVYGSPDGAYGRRHAYVPRRYQLGFDYWKGFECSHDYNDSYYFFNDDPEPHRREGYDAFPQARDAAEFIRTHAGDESAFRLITDLVCTEDVGAFNRTMVLGQLARDLTLENSSAHSGGAPTQNSLLELNRIRTYEEPLHWMGSLIDDSVESYASRSNDRHAALAESAIRYVQDHFAEPVSLQTIEDESGVTMSHFGKIFREQTGTTFHRYLTDVRLRNAIQLLEETDYPLRVIATECGFGNRQNLIRVFRRLRGATPTEYRRRANGYAS